MKPITKTLGLASILAIFLFWMSYPGKVEIAINNLPRNEGRFLAKEDASSTPRVSEEGYELFIHKLQADLSKQMHERNISKEDILRGWYFGDENSKKYATPEGWIFVEAGKESKWMSPNLTLDINKVPDKILCQETAGQYIASCQETTEANCGQKEKSVCECSEGTRWKAGQGCILVGERGSYVSINSIELEQGHYLGLPNQKKLNTPETWFWQEAGKNSSWRND